MQLGGFTQGGRERLELLGDFLRTVEAKGTRGLSNRDKTVLNREVAQERDGAVKDVLMLARMLKVRTGKACRLSPLVFHFSSPFHLHLLTTSQWMLFIPPAQIDAVWSLIVHATCQNELGIAAKVAPRPSPLETVHDRERLICVYTYDFSDKEDVARVLVRLKELDLVKSSGGKPIYYKTGKSKFASPVVVLHKHTRTHTRCFLEGRASVGLVSWPWYGWHHARSHR